MAPRGKSRRERRGKRVMSGYAGSPPIGSVERPGSFPPQLRARQSGRL